MRNGENIVGVSTSDKVEGCNYWNVQFLLFLKIEKLVAYSEAGFRLSQYVNECGSIKSK